MPNIDELQIEITTKAQQVDDTIDVLVKKLDLLSGSLKNINSINTSGLKKIANNFNNINKTTSSMTSGLTRINTSAQKTAKSFGGLASSIGKFYATWFFVIRGIKALGRSIEASADYVEAFNYYTVSFGKVASKWDKDWSNYGDENARNYSNAFVTELNSTFEKLSGVSFNPETGLLSETGLKNLGLNLRAVTEYAAQLGSMMDSVGHSGETTLATTQAFVKLAADMSSLRNIDYSTAGSKIRSVLQGQSRAGYEFGWDTTMASLQSMADRLDLSKAVSEMTQMEKQQLRILVILEQSRVAWGDQANTINTFANQTRILRNNMSELSMMLGQLFIPILDKIMPIVNGITIAIKNLMSSIAGFFGLKIDDMGQGFTELEDDSGGFVDSLDQATESAKKLRKQLQGFDKLNVITSPTDSGTSSGGGAGSGIDLTQQILDATAEYEKVWQEAFDRMENQAEVFAKKVEKALAPVKSLFQNIAIGDWFAVGQDVTNIVVGITDFFTKAIENVDWEKIGENIGLFIKGIDFTTILSSVGQLIWEAINAGIDLYGETFNTAPLETTIFSAIALLNFSPLGGMLATKIAKSLSSALASQGTIDILKIGFKSLFSGKNFDTTLTTLFTHFQLRLAGIGSIFAGLGLAVASFVDMFKNGFNIIKEVIMVVGIALTAVGAIILGAPALVAGVVAGIVASVSTLVIVIKDNWQSISSFFTNLATAFSVIWENVAYVITTNVLPEIERRFKNFVNGIVGFFEGMANGVISAINFIVKGLNKIKFDVPSWVPGIGGKKFGFNISLVKDVYIPRFETGGFPEDGFFFANHNELVGQFANGKTAVANNEQIVAGIERGVRDANAEQNALLREQNALLRQILAKDTGISTRDVFEAVRTENREYINRNGESAFAF